MISHASTELGVAPWEAEPLRLWSILDMQRFYGPSFLATVMRFGLVIGMIMERALPTPEGQPENPDDTDALTLKNAIDGIGKEIKEVPLSQVVIGQFNRLQEQVREKWMTDRERILLAREFHNSLLTELSSHLFLLVPSKRKTMFTNPEKWWGAQAVAKFGTDASSDMHETARCLALAQWTASVFHAMRVMEHGLRALGARLSVTFAKPVELEQWRNIIDQIEKEIRKQEQLPPTLAKTEELKFCSQAATHFWYTKEAWRNHVSHTRTSYGEVEAEKIVEHVRDFMTALAQ